MGHMKMTDFKLRVNIFRITCTDFIIFLPGYPGPSPPAIVNLSTARSVLQTFLSWPSPSHNDFLAINIIHLVHQKLLLHLQQRLLDLELSEKLGT